MSNLLSTLLIFLQDYGYPSLWISVFVAAIGIPLPISLVLLAAGAFAAMSDFNIVLLFILSFSALVCGDNVGYLIGRRWGSKALNWVEDSKRWNRLIPAGTIRRSRNYFQKRGWVFNFGCVSSHSTSDPFAKKCAKYRAGESG